MAQLLHYCIYRQIHTNIDARALSDTGSEKETKKRRATSWNKRLTEKLFAYSHVIYAFSTNWSELVINNDLLRSKMDDASQQWMIWQLFKWLKNFDYLNGYDAFLWQINGGIWDFNGQPYLAWNFFKNLTIYCFEILIKYSTYHMHILSVDH